MVVCRDADDVCTIVFVANFRLLVVKASSVVLFCVVYLGDLNHAPLARPPSSTTKLQGRSLTPSLTGFVVADLLREHFPDFTDTGFTAKVSMPITKFFECLTSLAWRNMAY